MSRIGSKLIVVPSSVVVTVDQNNLVLIKGPMGTFDLVLPASIQLEQKNDTIFLILSDKSNNNIKKFWGLYRSRLNNMIIGVSVGFKNKIEITGVGYKAAVEGNFLNMYLGYSHGIRFLLPDSIKATVDGSNVIWITGNDKQLVGAVAARIKSLRKPEPYKGKGVRINDEFIIRKEGKR